MVDTEMYSEIQKRKRAGYSQRAVARELGVDRRTIRQYWTMTDGQYAQYLLDSKSRTKILDPYRDFIVSEIEEYPEITSAIIDAKLRMLMQNLSHHIGAYGCMWPILGMSLGCHR